MAQSVEAFITGLNHSRKAEIELLRAAVLAADSRLSEQIKWNAPSFGIAGADRITFRLAPKDLLQLIFHRGAKVQDATGFSFADDEGLFHWAAPDRGVVDFATRSETDAKLPALVRVVPRWISATSL